MNKILYGFLIIGMICADVEGLRQGKRVFDEAPCGQENPTLSRLSETQPVEESSPIFTCRQSGHTRPAIIPRGILLCS